MAEPLFRDDQALPLDAESERLAQEKIKARLRLLAMPPEEAQKLVDMTLYPQYWKFRSEDDDVWSESLSLYEPEIDT